MRADWKSSMMERRNLTLPFDFGRQRETRFTLADEPLFENLFSSDGVSLFLFLLYERADGLSWFLFLSIIRLFFGLSSATCKIPCTPVDRAIYALSNRNECTPHHQRLRRKCCRQHEISERKKEKIHGAVFDQSL
jgi:hypothetical protein